MSRLMFLVELLRFTCYFLCINETDVNCVSKVFALILIPLVSSQTCPFLLQCARQWYRLLLYNFVTTPGGVPLPIKNPQLNTWECCLLLRALVHFWDLECTSFYCNERKLLFPVLKHAVLRGSPGCVYPWKWCSCTFVYLEMRATLALSSIIICFL